jgi:putative ABC transport system ATP-binding protein
LPRRRNSRTLTALNPFMNEVLIHASKLTRRYNVGKAVVAALSEVELTVPPGEFTALVGPSGSGKSTLLNLIGGLDRPTGGEVRVNGLSLGAASEPELVRYRRQHVGFIFQSFNLLPTLNAQENVEAPLMLAEVPPRDRRERAAALLESVGLAPRALHKPNELSGGEKQRVAIARAILKNPPVLMFDEATSSLDSNAERAILVAMAALAAQRTSLVIAHRLSTVVDADEILVLDGGRVAERGSHRQLLRAKGLYARLWTLQQREAEEQEKKSTVREPGFKLEAQ